MSQELGIVILACVIVIGYATWSSVQWYRLLGRSRTYRRYSQQPMSARVLQHTPITSEQRSRKVFDAITSGRRS